MNARRSGGPVGRDEHGAQRPRADVLAEDRGLVRALGGQVITVGHGGGQLNPLDLGAWATQPHLRDDTAGGM